MKKILLTLTAMMIMLSSCIAQANHKRGEIVGDPTNVVVDSIEKVGSVLMFYVNGSVIRVYNDSIETLSGLIDDLESRVLVLEGVTEDPLVIAEPHRITHDQEFVSHPNVKNGDYIGYVYILCTDSVFNNRTGGSYSWSIVSGNASSAFAINSSTGLLTVNNYSAINDDFTLGVKVSYGAYADTADCLITYRSGIEGTELIYIDVNDVGGSPSGTYLNPYQDFTAVDDFGQFADGMTVLIKRGTRNFPDGWQIDNQGDKIYVAAYGIGNRPIIDRTSNDERMMEWGTYLGAEGVNDCDSLVIMDLTFKGDVDYRHYAIHTHQNSNHNEIYRCWFDSINSGNGAVYVYGESNADLKVWDTEFSNFDPDSGRRAFKSESWGIEIENMYVHDIRYSAIMCGQYSHDWGSAKYLYLNSSNTEYNEAAIQARSPGIQIEWMVSDDYWYGVDFQNYDYFAGDEPAVRDISVTSAVIEGSGYGIRFSNPAGATTDVFDTITLEGLRVVNPQYTGIRLITSTNTMNFDNVVVKNCIVTGAPEYGVQINHAEQNDLAIQNNIFYNSTTTDIYSTGNLPSGILRNNIYDTKSSVTWGTEATNYDVSSGNPFVGSGDYRSVNGASTINTGTNISQAFDVLDNPITTQDIGPFEYGGTKFNWTDRE